MPYSGPVSGLSNLGRIQVGYLQMLNERGGVNGSAIKLVASDGAYSPPRTVEQTRRLVQQEGVLALTGKS
jgi:branched-chain amino acid transport system substrate-binding protein